MKISYTDDQKRILQLCGVPSCLLVDSMIDYKKLLSPVMETKDDKVICNYSVKDQAKAIKTMQRLYEANPAFTCLNSTTDFLTIRKFAVPWFYNFMHYCKTNIAKTLGVLPYWHYVDSSYQDSLLDILRGKNDLVRFDAGYKPLIVLDGIYVDSWANKIEKLRDMVNLLSDHHVILLLHGNNPYSFCYEKLATRPTNIVSFGIEKVRTVI